MSNKVVPDQGGHKRPKDTPMRQQTMKAYKPVPTVKSAAIIFTVLGVIFIIIGSVLLAYSQKIISHSVRYDDFEDCSKTTWDHVYTCNVKFKLDKDMDAPIFFYYQLNNYYQNHRRYVKSKSADQLAGNELSVSELNTDCDPIVTMKDLAMNKTQLENLNRPELAKLFDSTTIPANPCGLIAQSFFNDTFSMSEDNGGKIINISEKNIIWESDKKKYSKASEDIQWINVEDGKKYLEHFIVWMRTSGLPNFRKLWGKIEDGLTKGDYTVTIQSKFPAINDWEKYVVISTANEFGGDNSFLGIAYIVVGGITLILALAFVIRGYLFKKSDDLHYN